MASSEPRCLVCSVRLVWARTGRPRRYCSTRCRSRAMRDRRAAESAQVKASSDHFVCPLCGHLTPVDGACARCQPVLAPW